MRAISEADPRFTPCSERIVARPVVPVVEILRRCSEALVAVAADTDADDRVTEAVRNRLIREVTWLRRRDDGDEIVTKHRAVVTHLVEIRIVVRELELEIATARSTANHKRIDDVCVRHCRAECNRADDHQTVDALHVRALFLAA